MVAPWLDLFDTGGGSQNTQIVEVTTHYLHSDRTPVFGKAGRDAGSWQAGQVCQCGKRRPGALCNSGVTDACGPVTVDREGCSGRCRRQKQVETFHKLPDEVVEAFSLHNGVSKGVGAPGCIQQFCQLPGELIVLGSRHRSQTGPVGIKGDQSEKEVLGIFDLWGGELQFSAKGFSQGHCSGMCDSSHFRVHWREAEIG